MNIATIQTRADELTKKHTAFADFSDMLNALGNYRPSLYIKRKPLVHQHELRELADAYDAAQAERGDDRRAYRGDFK